MFTKLDILIHLVNILNEFAVWSCLPNRL